MHRIFFNAHKHHLSTIIEQIQKYVLCDDFHIDTILRNMDVQGLHRKSRNAFVDVYCGNLQEHEIKAEIVEVLNENQLQNLDQYRIFLEKHGALKNKGHYVLKTLSDETIFTLRIYKEEATFAHIHPGRYSPNTFRIKSNTLKTVILSYYFALKQNLPFDLSLINYARKHLELSPVTKEAISIYKMLQRFKKHPSIK